MPPINAINHWVMVTSQRLGRLLLLVFTLVAGGAAGSQQFTDSDQVLVVDWLSDAGLNSYSTSHNAPPSHDRRFYTHSTLLALHTSRPQRFYHYLSRRMIDTSDSSGFAQLLQPLLDLNNVQQQALDALVAQRDASELADWLQHYIGLEAHLEQNKAFSAQLFALLTQSTLDATGHCPEVATLEYFKSTKEQRQAVLQCLARSLSLAVLDIDISVNRVTAFKLLSPQPVDLPLPPPAMLDNSENHFVMLPRIYNNANLQPLILLTTPADSGFITTGRARHLIAMNRGTGKKVPKKGPLAVSERNAIRQGYGIPIKKDVSSTRSKTGTHSWLEFWITSPGYSIAASFVIGVGIALFVAYCPYPANPFLM